MALDNTGETVAYQPQGTSDALNGATSPRPGSSRVNSESNDCQQNRQLSQHVIRQPAGRAGPRSILRSGDALALASTARVRLTRSILSWKAQRARRRSKPLVDRRVGVQAPAHTVPRAASPLGTLHSGRVCDARKLPASDVLVPTPRTDFYNLPLTDAASGGDTSSTENTLGAAAADCLLEASVPELTTQTDM
eukprot:COSAG05_NODE_7755_length_773_cov_1.050445_1_plen_192_part_01